MLPIEKYFNKWSRVIDLKETEKITGHLLEKGKKRQICPEIKNLFKCFEKCPYDSLKAVIIGQDPYSNMRIDTGKPVATGIAFANSSDTEEKDFSTSLDIIRESVIDFTKPHRIINFDPSMEKWEEQGVLMLNSALSCELHRPRAHLLLWRPFMKKLLYNLSTELCGIIYVLMGRDACSLEPYINKETNYILKTRHPSYYARTCTKMPGSLWKDINSILTRQSGEGIKWFTETD